jgi:S-adenosylmethionine decarboxylase
MKRYEKYLKRGFGPHLILDGYGCSKSRLQDMDSVYKFLNEFPDFIGMRKIGSPDVDKILDDEKKEDWGVSGIVLIIESHISIHTFPG